MKVPKADHRCQKPHSRTGHWDVSADSSPVQWQLNKGLLGDSLRLVPLQFHLNTNLAPKLFIRYNPQSQPVNELTSSCFLRFAKLQVANTKGPPGKGSTAPIIQWVQPGCHLTLQKMCLTQKSENAFLY